MGTKVKLAIIDRTLQCKIKKYEINDAGDKIVIDKESPALNPTFNVDSYLDHPTSKWAFWKKPYDRIYYATSGASKCINFKTENVHGPDPQVVMDAAENKILMNMGKDEVKTPFWVYFIIIILLGIALKVFGAI